MGLVYDTAISADADLFSIGFEQEITNVLRQSGETDFAKLHKAATNLLIRSIPSAIDITKIANTRDFVFECVYWVLMTVYRGEESDALGRRVKFDEYEKAWQEQKDTRRYVMTDGSVIEANGIALGLPQVGNQDDAPFFAGQKNTGENPADQIIPGTQDDGWFNSRA